MRAWVCVFICVCRVCTYVFPIVLVSVSLSKKNPRKSIKKTQAGASVWVHFGALWKVQNKMPNACNSWCIYIFFFSLCAVWVSPQMCACVCATVCVCVCLCWLCATIVWCVRVCVAFPNSVPPPSPPTANTHTHTNTLSHTYAALGSRCSQHLRARYLLQIGLNSSAATAATSTATPL